MVYISGVIVCAGILASGLGTFHSVPSCRDGFGRGLGIGAARMVPPRERRVVRRVVSMVVVVMI